MSEQKSILRTVEPMVCDAMGLWGIVLVIHALHQWQPIVAEGVAGLIIVGACLLWARYRG